MTETANSVNLQDIAVVVQIIDACSERGAFKGNEMATVGALREKFNSIVEANMPKEVQEETEAGE